MTSGGFTVIAVTAVPIMVFVVVKAVVVVPVVGGRRCNSCTISGYRWW